MVFFMIKFSFQVIVHCEYTRLGANMPLCLGHKQKHRVRVKRLDNNSQRQRFKLIKLYSSSEKAWSQQQKMGVNWHAMLGLGSGLLLLPRDVALGHRSLCGAYSWILSLFNHCQTQLLQPLLLPWLLLCLLSIWGLSAWPPNLSSWSWLRLLSPGSRR